MSSEREGAEQTPSGEMDAVSALYRERKSRYEALVRHHDVVQQHFDTLMQHVPTSPEWKLLRREFQQVLREHHQLVLDHQHTVQAYQRAVQTSSSHQHLPALVKYHLLRPDVSTTPSDNEETPDESR